MKEQRKLIEASQGEMKRLAQELGLTVGLGVLLQDKLRVQVISQARGSSTFAYNLEPGHEILLYCSAPGKALLAWLPQEQRDELVEGIEYTKFTGNTITSPEAMRSELKKVRGCGYGLDVSEELMGCHCIGVAIKNEQGDPIASIWATGPCSLLPQEKFAAAGRQFLAAAQLIGQALGKGKRTRQQQYMQDVIVRAERYIAAHHAEDIDMEALAAELHLSYTWFRRSFKKVTGSSPRQYLIDYRLEKAAYLLSETTTPISDISARLGFSAADYFSTQFKKKYGSSPRFYRQQHSAE